MIWTPIGSPSGLLPIGIVVAGSPTSTAIPAQMLWSPYGTSTPSMSGRRGEAEEHQKGHEAGQRHSTTRAPPSDHDPPCKAQGAEQRHQGQRRQRRTDLKD